jgi:hypothetical protein
MRPFDLAATRAAGVGKVFLFIYNHAADYARFHFRNL